MKEPDDARPRRPNWRWRTFPVFCSFVAGLLVASLVNRETDTALEGGVQIAAIMGLGYAVAHLFVTNVLAAGRTRNTRAPQDEFDDEIVHPDDA